MKHQEWLTLTASNTVGGSLSQDYSKDGTWDRMQLSNVGRHLFICLQIVWKLSENSDHLSKTLCVVLVRNALREKEQRTYINQVSMICSFTVCVVVCYWGKSFVLLNITKTSYIVSPSSSLLFSSHSASKCSFSFSGQVHVCVLCRQCWLLWK